MNPAAASISPRTLGRQYLAAAVLGFLFFVVLAWFDLRSTAQLNDSLEWIEQTLVVNAELRSIEASLAEMEAAKRGYFLTDTPSYLEAFAAASNAMGVGVASVGRLTEDNPLQRANVARLTDLAVRKRAELQAALDQRVASGTGGTLAASTLTADIRALLVEMEREEDGLYVKRKALEQEILQRNAITRATFMVLVAGLIAATYFMLRREIAIRSRSEQALAESNAQLDLRVRERTRKLEQSEARIHGIIDSATDAIISIDESQTIVLTNAAARAMFRSNEAEMLGAPLTRFIPERYRATHHKHVQSFAHSGVSTRRMAAQRVVMGLRADGEEFPLDASISQLTTGDRKVFTVILRDITEAQKARAALEQSHAELRELSAALETAQEEERRRIARELHDELGQQLTAIRMDAHFIREQVPPAQSEIAQSAERLERMVKLTVQSVRRISADLRPMMLDDLGLVAALDELVAQVSAISGVKCTLVAADNLGVDEWLSTPLYRVAQESLNNMVKHAAATEATLSLFNDDARRLVMRIEDNGKGMTAEDRRKRKSFGLIGMRERVRAVGGEFSVVSSPMAGTRIEVSIPGASVGAGPSPAAIPS